MTCTSCSFEAPADFAFCPKCGTQLDRTCGSCGFISPPDFAYCPKCGDALASTPEPKSAPEPRRATTVGRLDPMFGSPGAAGRATADAETDRRLVTVLFADVSGFTALSERLDPEVVRGFQSDLFAELSAEIESYGGWIEKYVGDAIMAVFGAPVAHENDPERALMAALAMHARMDVLSERWQARIGGYVSLHIGVNTGLVVAGNLGGVAENTYVVTGDTVNTTARLESAAGAGQTLVSSATYHLTKYAFAFEALEPVMMKGKTEPVPVYSVLGKREAGRADLAQSSGLSTPTVGREQEIGRVWASFERSLQNRAQIVTIVGEAGVGKSRVMEGFRERLDASEHAATVGVQWVTCGSLSEQVYGVPAALFREVYGVSPDDDLEGAHRALRARISELGGSEEEAARVAPVVRYVLGLGTDDAPMHLEPEQLQRQIILAMRTLAEIELRHGPLVLVVENFHFVDAASVDLLRSMMDRLRDRPIMLLVDFRPSFDATALAASRASYTTVRLGRLSDEDCDRILDALLGDATSISDDVRAAIKQRAEGLPFFLEEIVRSCIESGALVREEHGWVCARGVQAVTELPGSVHSLLAARLDRLPADARSLIQVASVLGAEFRATSLAALADDPDWEALTDELIELELLEEVSADDPHRAEGRRFRFAHEMIRDVAYESQLLSRRTELHRRIAGVLEAELDDDARLEDLVALGHHLSLSGERPRAATYFVEAGERAAAIYANEDAERHFRRAVDTLEACDGCEAQKRAACERLADLLALRGERQEALALFEEVRNALGEGGDPVELARISRKTGRLHWDAGDRTRAASCFEAGLELLRDVGSSIERARLFEDMGRVAFRGGDSRKAVEWARRSLEEAEALAPESAEQTTEIAAAVSHAHNTMGISLARIGRLEEAVEHIEQSVSVAESGDLLGAACRGYANLGVLYSALDPRRAIETCSRGLEAAKRIGDLSLESSLHANLAVAYCALTDRCEDDGLVSAQAAIEIDRQLGRLDHLAVPLIVLGQIHQCHGDSGEALTYYREALSLAEEVGEPQLLFPCYEGIATVCLDQGDMQQAEAYMRQCQELCERSGLDPESLLVLPFLQ